MSHARTSRRGVAPTGVLLLLAAGALTASAQGLPPIDEAPHAEALRQAGIPSPSLTTSLEPSSTRASAGGPSEARLPTPAHAFQEELRDEAIEYRFTNRWAFADERLRGDRPVRRGRARAAESMLGDAAGAYLEALLRRRLHPGWAGSASPDEPARAARHRFRVDSSPTWRVEGAAGRTRLRLDVPLSAHEDLALRCTRPFDSDRTRRELGASLRLNPWDASIRFGFELEF